MKIEFEIEDSLKPVITLLSRATDNDINLYAKEQFVNILRCTLEPLEDYTDAFKPELRVLYDFEHRRQEQRKTMCEIAST